MKKTIFLLSLVVLCATSLLPSCKSGKALLPNVSGKAGEILVVIDKDLWEGSLGDATRELLACDCPYLPQKEPLYTLANVAPTGFADLFKIHRNIVLFNVGEKVDSASVIYKHDVWSQPQCVIQVNAKTEADAIDVLGKKSELILSSIEQAERDRVIRNTMLYEERSIAKTVSEHFEGRLHCPSGYKIRKAGDDFIWIADDKQYVYQDILIYKYPVTEAEPFSLDNIVAHRNEILKANVPGQFDGTYMTTSETFAPKVEYLKYRGRSLAQTRGWWEVEGDYMGGPFVSHSFYNEDGSEIIVVEAFVYAARFDKRQYLRQVESLLYTWEWNQKDEK